MLRLPSRLNELLSRDLTLHSFVLGTAATIAPWARDNKTVFFPEYTDHSLIHLNEVLATADSLISDESWPHLTAEDAALLVTSVLLHDSALHLSEDGFFQLIGGTYKPVASNYVKNDPPWPDLWNRFWSEARRFDQRKLLSIFGDTDPVSAIPHNKLLLTLRDRLLIGEFLRRHHARLAHEIALAGIPGTDSSRTSIGLASTELLDLCGFVARSHNLHLRAAVDALPTGKHRIHLNCHVPFAMSVLRIADFIQIHSSRASKQLLRLKSLVSPMSRGEWQKHEAILELHQVHDDPEAIYADAEPTNVRTFLSLRLLFSDIQTELDQIWAVLGEVYGRLIPLNSLGIIVRRIRSSLDDASSFARNKQLTYIPRQFRFRTASGELMDLLVAPLYGASPEIGIRELVQNGVDACLERNDLLQKGRIPRDSHSLETDVVVSLYVPQDGPARLVVEDHGVGMSLDIIDNYFLNIGASYRSSDIWRNEHEVDGHSTVHRTGRFGVGVLAAFLLGDEMIVTTSHIGSDEQGFTFTCRRGDDSIEVRPTRFHHGTRIEINLSSSVVKRLLSSPRDWDWYCTAQPKVTRRLITGSDTTLPQRLTVPQCGATLEGSKWKRIRVPNFDDVLWTHREHVRDHYGNSVLISNGIYVTSSLHLVAPEISPELGLFPVAPPTLVVFDPDGRLPINLQRNALAAPLPFQEELTQAVAIEFVAELVESYSECNDVFNHESIKAAVRPKVRSYQPGHVRKPSVAPLFLAHAGVLPADSALLHMVQPHSLLLDATNVASNRGNWESCVIVDSAQFYVAVDPITSSKQSRIEYIRGAIGVTDFRREKGFLGCLPIVGRRILLRKSDVAELVGNGGVPRTRWRQLMLESENERWGLWAQGTVLPLIHDFAELLAELERRDGYGFSIMYLDWSLKTSEADQPQKSALSEAWLAKVGKPILAVAGCDSPQRIKADMEPPGAGGSDHG